MGKPFKFDAPIPRDNVTGRFQPKTLATPEQQEQRAVSENKPPLQVLAEVRVSDHDTPKNNPKAAEEFETVKTLRATDDNGRPFRV